MLGGGEQLGEAGRWDFLVCRDPQQLGGCSMLPDSRYRNSFPTWTLIFLKYRCYSLRETDAVLKTASVCLP